MSSWPPLSTLLISSPISLWSHPISCLTTSKHGKTLIFFFFNHCRVFCLYFLSLTTKKSKVSTALSSIGQTQRNKWINVFLLNQWMASMLFHRNNLWPRDQQTLSSKWLSSCFYYCLLTWMRSFTCFKKPGSDDDDSFHPCLESLSTVLEADTILLILQMKKYYVMFPSTLLGQREPWFRSNQNEYVPSTIK